MAGIRDLYQDRSSLVSDASDIASNRLLSARSGVSNILANVHKEAGWAAPGIAALQGQEAARIGSENERTSQQQEFFSTFGKLLGVNGGAAAKFWTEHSKDVGIDAELDSIDAKPNEVVVSFKNGVIANIDKKNGTITTPDGQGGFRPWTEEDTAKFEGYAAKELKAKTNKGPAAEKGKRRAQLEKEYGDLINKAATAKLSGGKVLAPGEIQQNEARRAQIEADYLKEFGTPITKAPAPPAAPPAPTGTLDAGMGTAYGIRPPQLGGATPAAAPQVPAKRPLPIFR